MHWKRVILLCLLWIDTKGCCTVPMWILVCGLYKKLFSTETLTQMCFMWALSHGVLWQHCCTVKEVRDHHVSYSKSMVHEEIQSDCLAASNLSSHGALQEASLMHLNNPTKFRERNFFHLSHQKVMKVWLPDRKKSTYVSTLKTVVWNF